MTNSNNPGEGYQAFSHEPRLTSIVLNVPWTKRSSVARAFYKTRAAFSDPGNNNSRHGWESSLCFPGHILYLC